MGDRLRAQDVGCSGDGSPERRGGWKVRCRELTALTGALGAAFALLLWGAASPASAGGPTSVLLVSPESRETAALYYSDKEYDELARLLGSPGSGTRDKPPEADLTASRQINITWMVHDVTPWRLDQVYSAHKGQGVWIHTAAKLDSTTNGIWHRADHPTRLRALLTKLDLMGKASGEDGAAVSPPSASRESGTDEAAEAAPAQAGSAAGRDSGSASESGGGTDWWWSLPGAAAGAVLALVLRPFLTRLPLDRRRGEPGPHQELRDI
ncbi:hypothetical protein [Streptomyces sp. HD]|uniref:hypothetical protein n=1 Tax=Streptomyces sp. HD TaxID=3020892 RepID=UPI00233085A4|nr:hypothetical protein [Streptomyces sp. HD]MDC0765892.1 hypothetical protein [Streptomyces sp. HD]